jgi:hypothetical protein
VAREGATRQSRRLPPAALLCKHIESGLPHSGNLATFTAIRINVLDRPGRREAAFKVR